MLCVVLATAAHAQRISFCEKVDSTGKAISVSNKFRINKKGDFLYFHVNLPHEVGHDAVVYDLFWIDKDGKEHFDNSVKQKVQPGWTSFWKEISFYHSGTYRIYVYNDYDKFLCVGELAVVMK